MENKLMVASAVLWTGMAALVGFFWLLLHAG